ncbi:unnamed protein product [Rotaria socialis]|uniref:Relish n=1 Tax=Rotaria socialis TaxID=392032 RepID=A0A817TN12_9BILA|nr:unnamed protein product [Rotaria socialis]CAF4511286.1 unnamed protein product [Rotaria socialis]
MATVPDDQIIDDIFSSLPLSPTPSFIDAFSELNENEEGLYKLLPSNQEPFSGLSDSNNETLFGYSPQSSAILSGEQSSETVIRSDRIEIIAQPCFTSKLRTLKDNEKDGRRHTLKTKTKNVPFSGPTIRVPKIYTSHPVNQYYIGISLVTVFHEKSNCRYIHPYVLRDVDQTDRNDQYNNAVWYPIKHDNLDGIHCFTDLHIDKIIENELKNYGPLRRFYGDHSNPCNDIVLNLSSGRQIVKEYNIKSMQLAFVIAIKNNINDTFPKEIVSDLTAYSEEMTDTNEKESLDENNPTDSIKKSIFPPPDCRMYKYAPRNGSTQGNEEVLIFYTKKLEENKYGNIQVMFESDTDDIHWQPPALAIDVEVKGQMVSFKTPYFPFQIDKLVPVKIILRQNERILEPLRYFYVPSLQCQTCQAKMMKYPDPLVPTNSNKRTKFSRLIDGDDRETDALVPICESKTDLQQSNSILESSATLTSSNSASPSSINTPEANYNYNEQLLNKISDATQSLFINNDFKSILRICRPFIQKRPELLHNSISNNHSDLLTKFIPIASIDLLKKTNEFGETVLLHAIRLNRITTVKDILKRENSDVLFDDTNDRDQNIFHILAISTNSQELLDVIIDYLMKKSVNISVKFDHIDKDNHTPLQLVILNKNISITSCFLKYFNKTLCKINDNNGDNLIHFAVRYGDLTMIKLLLDDKELIEQGNQSNLTMTPLELARSLKHNDLVEYINKIYYQSEIKENESAQND